MLLVTDSLLPTLDVRDKDLPPALFFLALDLPKVKAFATLALSARSVDSLQAAFDPHGRVRGLESSSMEQGQGVPSP